MKRSLNAVLLILSLTAAPAAAVLFSTDAPTRPLALQTVVSGLAGITSVANAGDSRLFITEQPGRIRIVQNSAVLPDPFLDVSSLIISGGEQGLLSVAFHPHYAQNGLFFIFYTDKNGTDIIARYHVSADPNRADPASGRILLSIPEPFANHNGGELQFGPDGYLYAGVGDGGAGGDPDCNAQQGANLLGKILRLDVDHHADTPPYYAIPADNPFLGSNPLPDEIWAYGLRNPWRFSFDRKTGDLWIGDVGQETREEIDFQPAGGAGGRGGQDYGWKIMEASLCYSRQACPASTPACGAASFTAPVLEYAHGDECAVTGGYVSRSPSLPNAYGAYVFGDFCSGRVWTADRQGAGWQIRVLPSRVPNLSTFGEGSDGELYAASLDGTLYRIVPQHPVDTPALYDPAAARFDFKNLDIPGPADLTLAFGTPNSGQIPVAGDWNGDGRTTVGLYNPANHTFRLKNRLLPTAPPILLTVDAPSAAALPIAGDWNGDGKDTVGLYDPRTATFYLKNTLTGSGFDIVFRFGAPGSAWLPIAGDWDGDGKDGVGLYDPARGLFFLRNALTAGPEQLRVRFGPPHARPVTGDWDGDGKDGIGIWDPATGTFLLKNLLQAGPADVTFAFGTRGSGQVPLAGEW
ncbi:MAG TPA: PQQ-dependent sugar dehydrogenase [Thermoanaerobaculia bacterium]|jgi:glucose/arabinose dehydrogenase|nr:PQQ-dependent sugar dehydrogenase [Thermoanaerobaculia bacterium]